MNNQTTTEAKIARILEHEHSRSFCKREIMQLIEKEKKAVIEKTIQMLENLRMPQTNDATHETYNKEATYWNKQVKDAIQSLAHSQANSAEERSEDREGKDK